MIRTFATHSIRDQKELTGYLWDFTPLSGEFAGKTYKVPTPNEDVVAWKQALEAEGIQLFTLSNSRKPGRAQRFAEALGVPFQGHSGKPKKKGYLRAMERMGAKPEETIMVGDQIFTDILGGNNAGVTPLLVQPIRLAGNPGRYVRYAVETPFRTLGKRRPFV